MIEHWSSGPADDNMPEEMLVGTLQLVERHPWWQARAALACAILQRKGVISTARVLDVGCGWGVTLTALEQAGYRASGLDISPRILSLIDRPGRHLIEADLTQPLPPAEPADALLALDVIEHLDDDRAALRAMGRLLKPGGLALVSVPALPSLFSEFDEIQGHRRRYLPATLTAAFAGTGLRVLRTFWWGAWMVPVLWGMRQKQSSLTRSAPKTYAEYLRLPPWPVQICMRLAYAFEHRLALRGLLPTGTSLFALAKKS